MKENESEIGCEESEKFLTRKLFSRYCWDSTTDTKHFKPRRTNFAEKQTT